MRTHFQFKWRSQTEMVELKKRQEIEVHVLLSVDRVLFFKIPTKAAVESKFLYCEIQGFTILFVKCDL